MTILLGSIIVIASVLGGYVLSHGELVALWQPFEVLIIGGAALGGFIISNSVHTIKAVFVAIPKVFLGDRYNKALYMDLLSLMHDIFDKARRQGVMSIEADVDDPKASEIFMKYPAVLAIEPLIEFVTDYMRIISTGNMAPHELEGLMDLEIESRLTELQHPAHAVHKVADALPGFGIVAAVLGIVITMQALGGPPAMIGQHVAAALVGTFFGILLAYGFVGPLSTAMESMVTSEIKALECVKVSILATMGGLAPQMAVEFGRKALNFEVRPSFQELNDYVRAR